MRERSGSWAANKYQIKMEVDDNRLSSNSTVFSNRRKKKIGNNAQKREKASMKAVAKVNPTVEKDEKTNGNLLFSEIFDQDNDN